MAVLLRIYDISSGKVTIDSKDIRNIPLSEYQSSIAVVSQKTFTFTDTIRNNILLGHQVLDSKIWEVLDQVGLSNLISQFPKGLESIIHGKDVKLCEGHRQRLCIARELLKEANLLILDEPSSSADKSIQSLFQWIAQRPNVTTICISHNLEVIQDYAKIMIIERGFIKEFATINQLKNSSTLTTIIKS